jgi:hypothetical protein
MVVLFCWQLFNKGGSMAENSSKNVKGWQIVIVAAVLYIISAFVAGVLGKAINVSGTIAIFIGIFVGISNIIKAKKFYGKDIIGSVASLIAIVVALTITGYMSNL